MFFEGDLQAGVDLVLKGAKPIVCFVKDDGDKSLCWQNEFLKQDEVAAKLATDAVTLRIQADSQEARFLSVYCPISVVPTLIIIHNGQLILELKAEASKHDFKNAILSALRSSSSSHTTLPATSPISSDLQPQPATANPSSSNYPTNSNRSSTETENESAPPTTSTVVQDLFQDRRRRIEAEITTKREAKRAEREAKAKAQREEIESASGLAKTKQINYAQQQRIRQQQEKEERDRIRRDIEYDKAARKEKEELRRALHRVENKSLDGAEGLVDQQLSEDSRKASQSGSNHCAIQVRLFDGSTIRRVFQPHQTLRADVRAWVDEQGTHRDEPYTFKQVLTPLSNRTIGVSEEEETLLSLDLLPSATLIMVPVSNFTEAYSSGPLSRGLSTGYEIASLGFNMITGALNRVLGFGQATQQAEQPSSPHQSGESSTERAKIRIRSLQDQRQELHDHQLYNGNQLNFEPRRDDEDAED